MTIKCAVCLGPTKKGAAMIACSSCYARLIESSLELTILRKWRDAVVQRARAAGLERGVGLCDWFEELAREVERLKGFV